MKNNKGFTLIEILTVIIILGLLLSLAIPAVSKYVEGSRGDTYIDAALNYITAAATGIANGDFVIHEKDTIYYIQINNVKIEKNGVNSPYGKWLDAYVIVAIDEDNAYRYFWTSVDDSGHRVDITESTDLKKSSIYVSKDKVIDPKISVDERCKIVVYDKDKKRNAYDLCEEDNSGQSYLIVFDDRGGTSKNGNLTLKYGQDMPEVEAPVRSGHTFAGYYSSPNGRGTQYYSNTGEALRKFDKKTKLTLYADWSAETYTIMYDANGGLNPPKNQTKEHDVILKLSTSKPTRNGYSFVEWNTKKNGDGNAYKAGANFNENGNITLYAQWGESNEYVLTYDNNNGEGCLVDKSVPIGSATWGELCTPRKVGYTFEGWYTELTGGTQITATTVPSSNELVYARWKANKYTIVFDANGGTGTTNSVQCTYDQKCRLTVNGFTKSGYRWNGWSYLDKSYSDQETVENLTSEKDATVTMVADWGAGKYTIVFVGEKNTTGSTASIECEFDQGCMLPQNGFSKTGYHFTGWSDGKTTYKEREVVRNLGRSINDTVTLTAKMAPNVYTITFDGNGNDSGSTPNVQCTYDQNCKLPTNGFKKIGYTFFKWIYGIELFSDGDVVKNLTNKNNGEIVLRANWQKAVEGNMVIYASWPNPNSISIRVEGLQSDEAIEYQYYIENALQQKWTTSNSYTFSGLTEGNGYNIQVEAKMKSQNISGIMKFVTIYTPRHVTTSNVVTGSCSDFPILSSYYPADNIYGSGDLPLINCSDRVQPVTCFINNTQQGTCLSNMLCNNEGLSGMIELQNGVDTGVKQSDESCNKRCNEYCNDLASRSCSSCAQYEGCCANFTCSCGESCTYELFDCSYSGIIGNKVIDSTRVFQGIVYPKQTRY